ncbi:heterokaryon incompatibility (het-6OR allele) [Fusarium subglutinans]|uniref:Heterokaryon incompatibility (Het-6OR allele) n=1 Tax=Gibberella subglutinans TaxID=42677 RepID=A0A8H5QBH1_GIBSU|nr:heterokaryon incompatibility (het-6OR allele) [Fusarium subglutinans]KAF5611714.1 heterokaryon incompatibility (het-6OR allele) [Fusarium subglutinans]
MRSSSWTTLRRSSTFSTKYKYESTLDSTHIRLVKIRPRTRSLLTERLNIDVTTHSLDEAKALGYHALSYTWGAPVEGLGKRADRNSCILVNGDRFYVQPNLFGALKRFEEFDWYLWIDAICIDQTNQREREIQVGIMSEVYSMAARVDIWLGDGGKDPAEAIRLTRALSSLAEETRGSEVSLDKSEIEGSGLPPIPSKAWEPFVDLLDRNWFRRAWVIQETVLARQTFVFLGNSECISWEQLTSALIMIQRLGWYPNATLAMVKVHEIKTWTPGPYAIHFIGVINISLESLRKTQDHPQISLIEDLTGPGNWKTTASSHLAYMIMICHKFKVTNARDRVYSLLGMVNMAASHMGLPRCDLEVDYNASVAEVFTAATAKILNHCNHLGFISLAGIAEFHHGTVNLPSEGIPSWVPNFSNEPSAARTAPILFPWGRGKVHLDAARYSEIGSLRFSITGSRLSVQAQRIGQILPGSYPFYALAYFLHVEPFAAMLLRCGKRYKATGELTLEASWRTFTFGANIDEPIDASELSAAFRAWLCWILFQYLRVWDASMTVDQRLVYLGQLTNFQSLVARDGDEAGDMLPSMEWVKQMLQKLGASDPPDSQLASIFSFMERTSSLGGFAEEFDLEWTSVVAKELADTFILASNYASLLGTYAGQRRVFLTDEGHIGLGFSSALEGDSVWVVSACPVPLVMRPRADGTYQIIGDSYVHGIMEGEGVKDNSWEEITIT